MLRYWLVIAPLYLIGGIWLGLKEYEIARDDDGLFVADTGSNALLLSYAILAGTTLTVLLFVESIDGIIKAVENIVSGMNNILFISYLIPFIIGIFFAFLIYTLERFFAVKMRVQLEKRIVELEEQRKKRENVVRMIPDEKE